MNIDKCPLCGCEEIGEGEFIGAGGLDNPHATFQMIPSTVCVDLCTDCGYVIAMRVKNPNKFKKNKKK